MAMHPAASTSPVELMRWTADVAVLSDDLVATEEPLEIRLGGRSLAVVMRTPGHDRELAAGFLLTEGIVRTRGDVLDLVYCREGSEPEPNILDVLMAPGVTVDWDRLQRHTFSSSSC